MQVPLDSITQTRLDALAARRQRLARRRGVAATLLALIAALAGAAAIDRVFILPDEGRWALSAGVYLLVLAAAWKYWIRPVRHSPDWPQLARFIENARPELREDLISAVELGAINSDAETDSPEFRAILQSSVGERMRDMEAIELLPPRLIRGWIVLAALALLVFVGLFSVREIHFGRLIARALLPMANIERVSNTRLTILAPTPPDSTIPQGDMVLIRVGCAGPLPEKATLEIARAGHKSEPIPMLPTGQGAEFQAAIQTDESPISYRIRARDALTRRYTITPRLRPYVTAFDITSQPPAYTHRQATQESNVHRGDLTALAGSSAQLILHTDQPVNQAVIEMEQAGKFSRVPVQILEAQKLRADIPIQAGGEYKLSLVSAETGFDNGRFSPRYEIKALADELPVARLIEPAKDQLVPPNEIVTLVGQCSDDVGLARITQRVTINDGPARELPLPVTATLPSDPAVTLTVRNNWDLATLNLKPGDRLTTRLVATDLKGSTGESAPVRIMIASPGFSPADTRFITAQRSIFELLRQFKKVSSDTAVTARETATRLNPDSAPALAESVARLQSAANRLQEEADTLEKTMVEAIRSSPGRAGGWQVAMTGMIVARIHREWALGSVEIINNGLAWKDPGKAREAFNRAAEMLGSSEREAGEALEIFTELLISDESSLLMQDLVELQREQEQVDRLLGSGSGDTSHLRWARRQKTALDQIKQIEARCTELAGRYPGQPAELAKSLAGRLHAIQDTLTRQLGDVQAHQPPPAAADRAGELVRQARTAWAGYHADQADRASNQRRRLEQKLPPLEQLQNELADRMREVADQNRQIADREARGDSPADMIEDHKRLKDLEASRNRRWRTLIDLYADRAQFEEARPDHDPAFVSDLDLMHRALKAIRTASLEDEATLKSLSAVNGAFKTLDAGHGIADLATILEALRDHERWESTSVDSYTAQPQVADFGQQIFSYVPDRLPPAGFPGNARDRLVRARDGAPWRESLDQMNQRRRTIEPMVRVNEKLERVAAEAADVKRDVQWRMDQARKVLAANLPSVSDVAAGLAEKAEKMRQAALNTAADLERRTPQEAGREITDLRKDQADLGAEIQDLQESLRRQANLEDLATPAGREKARDADDAVALVQKPLNEADNAIDAAHAAPEKPEQAEHLAQAADREGKLADALRQVAKHEKLLAAGADVTASRAELRAAESELGIQEALDQQFATPEQLAAMAALDPEQQREAMERELNRDEAMRDALSTVAKESLDQARSNLEQASEQENKVSTRLQQPTSEERSRRDALAQRLEQVGQRSQSLSSNELKSAREHAEKAQAPANDRLKAAEQSIAEAHEAATGDASKPIEEVAADAKETAAKLTDAVESMKRAAEASRRTAQDAQRAGAKGQERAQEANQASQTAMAAAETLKGLAQEARQIAQEATQRTPVPRELNNSQDPIAKNVEAAAQAIERAARLEDRNGNQTAAQSLDELGNQIESIGKQELPAATSALRTKGAGQADQAVEQAQTAIDAHLAELSAAAEAAQRAAQHQGQASGPEPAGNAMARALAQLDQALAPGSKEGRAGEAGKQALADSAALMKSAAAAAARSMRQARASGRLAQGKQPRSNSFTAESKSGASVESPTAEGSTGLPELGATSSNTPWGKLPPKLAQDLMAGRREKVAEEYRDMVDTYFKVIAEKAKGTPK